ncbi:restriction endonuclease [Pseudomonas sp. N-137]|uniref:restriction endonuclease n=1 Tax=Pseudomonas sp. N-137 TaxID=3108452 RepID=UPI002ADEEA54|nr:restriction endonuclease [Pseudomonas sp. N-137]MEA1031063.1 restriction endonuclease [Pseudomonas sp. N-137]
MLDVKNSTEYEKVAQQVYEAILATDDVQTIEVLHNVQITGRSGVAHQIDVYWRYLKDGTEHQVLVECKYYRSTIDLIHARNLLGLLTDIPNSQGVLLTTVGFQKGVVNLCNFYGISLKRLRNPQGSDWDGFIQKVEIEGRFHKTDYLDFSFKIDGKDDESIRTLGADRHISVNLLEAQVQDGTDSPVGTVTWLDRNVPFDESQIDRPLTITLTPPNTYIILPSGQRLKILSLHVQYVHSSKIINFGVDAMDLVRGVLEDFNTKEIDHTLHY